MVTNDSPTPAINVKVKYSATLLDASVDGIDALLRDIRMPPEFIELLDYLSSVELEALANLRMDSSNPTEYQFKVYYQQARIAALQELAQLLAQPKQPKPSNPD